MTSAEDLLTPVEVAPAYTAVLDRLRRSIALGLVLPGEKLPPERTLADGLGVSRLTVREALRVLQGEGLIVTKRGGSGGAVVTSREVTAEEIRAEVRRTRPQIDEVFDYRLAVETATASLAAQRRSRADLDRLAGCQKALLASADAGAFRQADSAFHLTVADASANAMLRRSIEDARAAAFSSLDTRPFRPLRESSAAGHGAVVDAIESQDPAAAAEAMTEHLRQARREVLAVLMEDDEAS
jgi:DNA-binding FadR family transcriptional regulator